MVMEPSDWKKIDFEVVRQGKPVVNDAWLVYRSDTVNMVEIDLKSKWCQVGYTAGTNVGIEATDRSNQLDETWEDDSTEISFPRYQRGWRIWVCELNRYTLRICFVCED